MAGAAAMARRAVLASALLAGGQALTLAGNRTAPYMVINDHVIENTHYNSKPGSATFEDWSLGPLFAGGEEWRGELGARALRALRAGDAMGRCKSFVSTGDYTWCRQVMPKESGVSQRLYTEHEYVVPKAMYEKFAVDSPDDLLGLSFGASPSDAWSEMMSNKYFVKTKLFDCKFEGPSDLHGQHSKKHPCATTSCYSVEYEVERVCLDDSAGNTESFVAKNGMTYQPLSVALQGRKPLSTFVKLDVEGAEWDSLQWLVGHDGEVEKIRSLDVHLHLVRDVAPGQATLASAESMRRHVSIMEQLGQKFAVVGSSVEGSLLSLMAELKQKGRSHMREPLIHTQGGLPLEKLTVSYMNRLLL